MDAARTPRGRLGWALLVAVFTVSMACHKPAPQPAHESPPRSVVELYSRAASRLLASHVDRGWVVSRQTDGSPEHVGDSLLWTGLALAALPCADGAAIESGLVDMLTRHDGALVRYEPLGEYEGGREVTVDGALGLYRGIAHRIVECGAADAWREAFAKHWAYLNEHGGSLNEAAVDDAWLIGGLEYVPHLLAHRLALSGPPDSDISSSLEAVVTGWAVGVNATHAACYRIHLGWLALSAADALGEETSDNGRASFCAATVGTDLPVVDNWCGRGDLKGWIDAFEFNKYEFRHQRCHYERADGNGYETPALDLLLAIKLAYAI